MSTKYAATSSIVEILMSIFDFFAREVLLSANSLFLLGVVKNELIVNELGNGD